MPMSRRSSSIGNVDLGDNQGPSLSTMKVGTGATLASQSRQRALSGDRGFNKNGRPRSLSRPAGGLYRVWLLYREFIFRNHWVNPLLILLLSVGSLAYTGFDENSWLYPFVCLSYKIPGSNPPEYGKGRKDLCFVAFYMIFFTFFREFCMSVILRPLASFAGLSRKSKIHRFMEQTYSIIYYSMSGALGLYIMYQGPIWYFNTTSFYQDFPHKTNEFLFKAFYLLQAAFWAQQSVVLALQLEKPRKDFMELVFHHIVTIALIFLSYKFHFTRFGLAVYITMDISDAFLATSKTLSYLDSIFTAPFFITFMGVWIYLRHYQNLRFLWSILTEFKTVGDFTLNWETQQYKCWISQYITFGLVSALQLVNLYWLFLIFRIFYRLAFQNIQKDERSDDEDEEEEEEEEEEKKKK